MLYIISISKLRHKVDPEKAHSNEELVYECPKVKENYIDSTFCRRQFHFQSPFLNDIHHRCRSLKTKKSITKSSHNTRKDNTSYDLCLHGIQSRAKNVPLTNPIIKHSGHKTPATPEAPPELSASGSIEVNILGMRQTNNDIKMTRAQRNFRSVGTLRRTKYLRKQKLLSWLSRSTVPFGNNDLL